MEERSYSINCIIHTSMYNKIIASLPSYSISAIALYIVFIHQIDTVYTTYL